jgi:threonine dehydrogenase-like Zn-dependent dehydrogenase
MASLVKHLGAGKVIALDSNENRLNVSRSFGVDVTIRTNIKEKNAVIQRVLDETAGSGADLVVEATGDSTMFPVGIRMIGNGGRYLSLGALCPNSRCTVDTHKLIVKCIAVKGVYNHHLKYLGYILRFMAQHGRRYPFKDLVGPCPPFTVAGVEEAFKSLQRGESIRPVIVA